MLLVYSGLPLAYCLFSVVVTVLLSGAHLGFCIECCVGKLLLDGLPQLLEYLLVLFLVKLMLRTS